MVRFHIHHKELATLQDTTAPLGTFWRVLPLVLVLLGGTGVDTSQIAQVRKVWGDIQVQCNVLVFVTVKFQTKADSNNNMV